MRLRNDQIRHRDTDWWRIRLPRISTYTTPNPQQHRHRHSTTIYIGKFWTLLAHNSHHRVHIVYWIYHGKCVGSKYGICLLTSIYDQHTIRYSWELFHFLRAVSNRGLLLWRSLFIMPLRHLNWISRFTLSGNNAAVNSRLSRETRPVAHIYQALLGSTCYLKRTN